MGVTYRHMGISYSLKDDKEALIFLSFNNQIIMKKFIYFLSFALFIALVGCSKKSTNEPTDTPSSKSAVVIKGHTYQYKDGTGYINFYFSSNMTVSMTSKINGEYTSNSALTYKIDNNNVDIYRDNSTYWKEAYRGKLLYHMVYYPSEDVLVVDGLTFKRMS